MRGDRILVSGKLVVREKNTHQVTAVQAAKRQKVGARIDDLIQELADPKREIAK